MKQPGECFAVERPDVRFVIFVKTGSIFNSNVEGRSFHINHSFDCGVVYLITCRIFCKQYAGSTTTPFRMRFNNHKSSLIRFGNGQRGICGEHLYAHFFEEGHSGLKDLMVQIIDVTDVTVQCSAVQCRCMINTLVFPMLL